MLGEHRCLATRVCLGGRDARSRSIDRLERPQCRQRGRNARCADVSAVPMARPNVWIDRQRLSTGRETDATLPVEDDPKLLPVLHATGDGRRRRIAAGEIPGCREDTSFRADIFHDRCHASALLLAQPHSRHKPPDGAYGLQDKSCTDKNDPDRAVAGEPAPVHGTSFLIAQGNRSHPPNMQSQEPHPEDVQEKPYGRRCSCEVIHEHAAF